MNKASHEQPINFRQIFDCAQGGFAIYSASGELLYRNKVLAQLLGATAQFGESIYKFKEEGRFSTSPVIEAIQKKHSVSCYVQHICGKHLFATAFPVFNETDKTLQYIFVTQRDITDCYHFQEELIQSKIIAENYKKQTKDTSPQKTRLEKYGIIDQSEQMQRLLDTFSKMSSSSSTILLLGETGVGKTMLARYIHQESSRSAMPFVSLNCSTLPRDLVEAELFGYEKGSFTGAATRKIGMFEAAQGGTIFLDEISEMPLSLQAKLLSVLEEHKVRRIGSTKQTAIDVRVIAATNRDLKEMVNNGSFRRDLFYRLNSLPFTIPPLRKRPRDIVSQIKFFLDKHNRNNGTNKILSEETFKQLLNYSWPGNSRELYNVIGRLVELTTDHVIQLSSLPDEILFSTPSFENSDSLPTYKEHMEKMEKILLEEAKKRYGSVRRIAQELNMSSPTVCRKLAKYGL